eukprot:INCI13931.2.p1 GENE.INCI13931.2~~INCI13931.2.p1  ORF type:complete len:484 (+),score=96.51 INCI13931.2:167-1618(+)
MLSRKMLTSFIGALGRSRNCRVLRSVAYSSTTHPKKAFLSGSNFVAGNLSRSGTDCYAALSPLGQYTLPCDFYNATEDEITEAVQAAAKAFRVYRRKSTVDRANFLRAIGHEIEGLGEDLIERAHHETGLPLPRLRSERARTVDQLRKFANFVEDGSWVNSLSNVGGGVNIRRMQVPVGPVTVFGASNFPLAFSVAGGDTAAALAAGCPVVVKVHPSHPGTSELVATAIERAIEANNMPDGVFSLLHGTTPEIGADIVTRSQIKAVGFTGSIKAGRALYDLCAARPDPIPVFAEMGSVNPVVLLPESLQQQFDSVVSGLASSMTLGAGQFCTKPGIVFLIDNANGDSSVVSKFKDALARAVENIPAQSMLTPTILEGFLTQVEKFAAVDGVETLTQERHVDKRQTEAAGVVQVVKGETFLAHRDLLAEEAFGPYGLVVVCKDLDEMLEALESLQGQLTATIWGVEAAMLRPVLFEKSSGWQQD